LRGRTPVGCTPQLWLGTRGGEAARHLRPEHLPRHHHPLLAAAAEGDTTFADGAYLAASPPGAPPGYTRGAGDRVALHPDTVASGPAGTVGAALDNMQPYLALNWCIAFIGVYPQQE
jgi:microcystin-dependent protein